MPTPIQHLALAEDVLRGRDLPVAVNALLNAQRGPFLLGHTAPDVQTVSGQTREETHFYAIPRATERPAHETLFAAHPTLAHAEALPLAQAAFIAGYIAHLLLDELWLDDVFLRYVAGQEWGTRRERSLLHNVLRTWMDRQDLQRLNGSVPAALRQAEPCAWLPFVSDEHLCAWRDWLVEQLGPGREVQTAEVFARRMDVPVAEMEIILRSSQRMEEHVFSHIPRAALQNFHDAGYARSVDLIIWYLLPIQRRSTQ
jgi:hypothetical protein